MRRRAGLVSILALAVVVSSGLAEAQEFRWLAFGDSITKGNYDFQELGGYPGRLHNTHFNCSPGVCEVFNAGLGGEKTYQAVTRIDVVLNEEGPFDIMMLMEGTNDIYVEASVEAAVANLGIIANKARVRGIDTVHASIIWFHPGGTHGTSKDDEVEFLRDSMESLAAATGRYFVDIWDVLCPASHPDVHGHGQNQCFNRHYSDTPPDTRGHPIGSGYWMMSNAFYAGLTSVPIPSVPEPVAPVGVVGDPDIQLTWDREQPVRATWYHLRIQDQQGLVLDKWVEARPYCSGPSCSYPVWPPLADGEYTWRARGRNPAGRSAWSAPIGFQVDTGFVFADDFESGDTGAWSPTD